MQLRESLDVHFINDRLVRRDLWAAVVAPGKGFVEHGPQRRELGVVALVEREVGLGIVQLVAEHLVGPARLASDRLGVRIEEDLVRIEPMPFGRLVRSVNAVTVDLPRQHVRQIARARPCRSVRGGRCTAIPSRPRDYRTGKAELSSRARNRGRNWSRFRPRSPPLDTAAPAKCASP